MTREHHDEVTRHSFRRQVGLFSGPTSPFARRSGASLDWLGPLDDSMVVLEVACGAAHVAESIAPHVRHVVGLDLTRELLDLGAERLRGTGARNVLLQEGNAETLPFLDESFDLVCCRSSLHHFSRPDLAIREMTRVCRGGGNVVLVDLVTPSAEVRDAYDHLHRLLDPSHLRVFTEAELADAFPAGLTLTHGQTDTIRLPLGISVTEQSDAESVESALRNELAGGPATGFEPIDNGAELTVEFAICTVMGTRSGPG